MGKVTDLTGQRFGRLVVVSLVEIKGGHAYWHCKCDCGAFKNVSSSSLRNKHVQSCGCLNKEMHTKHGLRKSKIYQTWLDMRNRCSNPKNKRFKRYGGRGITVCDEWRNDFQAFYDCVSKLEHFGEDGYTLDRIDNDGNYEPGNVRWATIKEQSRNRHSNHYVNIGNEKQMLLADIAEMAGVDQSTIRQRLKRGWTGEKLLKPARAK